MFRADLVAAPGAEACTNQVFSKTLLAKLDAQQDQWRVYEPVAPGAFAIPPEALAYITRSTGGA